MNFTIKMWSRIGMSFMTKVPFGRRYRRLYEKTEYVFCNRNNNTSVYSSSGEDTARTIRSDDATSFIRLDEAEKNIIFVLPLIQSNMERTCGKTWLGHDRKLYAKNGIIILPVADMLTKIYNWQHYFNQYTIL